MKRSILAIAVFFNVFLATGTFAACRAVLIGVEDYPHVGRRAGLTMGLPGPSNDVKRLSALLENRYGVKSSDMRIVRDSEATHEGIKAAISGWLTETVAKGDLALIYFSGHGSQLPDANGDEQDGKDEALVCDDVNPDNPSLGQYVIDDELAVWFKGLAAKGARVVFVADCCHSGTISRDMVGGSMDKFMPAPPKLVKDLGGWASAKSMVRKEASQDDDADVTLVAACLDDQTSATACFPGVFWMGAFTHELVDYLGTSPVNPTYHALAGYLQKSVSVRFHQTPQVSGPDLSARFLETPDLAPPTVTTVVSTTTQVAVSTTAPAVAPATVGSNDTLSVCLRGFGANAGVVTDALRATGYVSVVSNEADADRVLVRRRSSGYDAHFDLRDGSVEATVIASDASEMVKKLRPSLLKAYVWKRLVVSQSDDPSLAPQVSIDSSYPKNLSVRPTAFNPAGTVVKIGAKTVFSVSAAKPCYMTLIDLPTEGPLTVLFPNDYSPACERIEANRSYAIPSEQMNFDILAAGPPGRDIVIAIASNQPLDLTALKLSSVDQQAGIRQSTVDDAGARLFRVVARPNSSVLPTGGFAIAYVVAEVVE